MIETQKYVRKPLYVNAVRVTVANFDEVAAWCQGEIVRDEQQKGHRKRYIAVRVHNPKHPRQSKAFIGDWILYNEKGYKVYTNMAFRQSFDLAEGFSDLVEQARVTGENGLVTEPVPIDHIAVPESALEDQDPPLDKAVNHQIIEATEAEKTEHRYERSFLKPGPSEMEAAKTLIESEGGTVEEATPQAIVEQVIANQPDMVVEREDGTKLVTDFKTAEDPPTVPTAEGAEVADSPTAPPVQVEGKRVISEAEQANMDPSELRALLQSGEVLLAQDLVA